jgi:hypothetical protein
MKEKVEGITIFFSSSLSTFHPNLEQKSDGKSEFVAKPLPDRHECYKNLSLRDKKNERIRGESLMLMTKFLSTSNS